MAAAEIIDLRRARQLRRHLPAGRTLHLVDLENLAGGSGAGPADVDLAFDRYERLVRFGEGDHRIVACARRLALPAKDRWRGALVKAAHGIDGAGVEVCVVSRRESLARRLREVAPVVWYLDDDLASAA